MKITKKNLERFILYNKNILRKINKKKSLNNYIYKLVKDVKNIYS